MKCRRCKSRLVPDVVRGFFKWQSVMICPRYRWWSLILHDVVVLS